MTELCAPQVDKLKLVREGTEQGDRVARALDPSSTPVHGRGPAHALLFAREYAAFLRHYSSSNEPDGDWRGFFGNDVSVALAAAAVQDVDRYRRVIRASLEVLEDLGNAGSPEVVRRALGYVFGALGTLAAQIDALEETLPNDIALEATIRNLVKTRLAGPLKKLVAWYRADQQLPEDARLIEPELVAPEPLHDNDLSILGVAPRSFAEMLEGELSSDWLGGTSWADLESTAPDPSVFGDPAGSLFERANTCAGHNLFTGVCDRFLEVYARIVADARKEFEATLTAYDRHEPHYALLLAFLRMFEYARADVNTLGGKHLDFYYRNVLQLAERPAEPARAHVLLELAKGQASHELAQGTEFKAGKDAEGNLVVFTSDATLVANRATVDSVRTLYRDSEEGALYVEDDPCEEGGAWHPFRNAGEIGSFGFSVASHYLFLAEGKRTVTLRATVDGASEALVEQSFLCRLTTEDGWLEASPSRCEVTDAGKLEIELVLDGDQPAVSAFDEKKHGAGYDVALPVLEVRLAPVAGMSTIFQALEPATVSALELAVSVKGFRGLVLSTDLGPADASKPFQPFGPAPAVGSALVVGCQEAFSKKGLTLVELCLTWRGWSGNAPAKEVALQRLSAGKWEDVATATILQTTSERVTLTGVAAGLNANDDPWLPFVSPYGLKATSGYVRLRLKGRLGHEGFAAAVAEWALKKVADPSVGKMPDEPYTPELEAITLDYEATQSIDLATTKSSAFQGRTARFYHLTSFGLAEQHAFLRTASEEDVPLMPRLRHRDAGTAVPHEGELYVGLAGVAAPQQVALLFQVEDGSADPLTEKPSPHLHFSYLRDNDWVALTSDQVDDRTSELLSSGILTLSIPEDATTIDTLLPGGLTWIRIAAATRTQAVCRLLDVLAQAVQVTFEDRGNDPAFLSTPLAADAIAKLLTPVASVKAVSQPYPSFGSRPSESAAAFRTRVSERLRHKNRAVALWDVERLVLGAFPSIHRVKCLNHTRYEASASGEGIYRELAAGHLTVVTIPEASEGYAADPLTPYTSLSVLEEVQAYLEKRLSCFATLHVCNPAYERLRVSCNVRLREGCDETYYLAELRTAITRFLAPWAFDAVKRPSFGGRIYRSSIVHLLEEQSCVDFVTDLRLYRRLDDGSESEAQAVVEGTRAVSVLASVPADDHVLLSLHVTDPAGAPEVCGCSR